MNAGDSDSITKNGDPSEKTIQTRILLALSATGLTVFRQNTGLGWVGVMRRVSSRVIQLSDARPLHAGLCKGSADIVGWKSISITPEMVGKKMAVFVAIECKTKSGRVSPEQENFLGRVRSAGGIAGVARSPEEAKDLCEFA